MRTKKQMQEQRMMETIRDERMTKDEAAIYLTAGQRRTLGNLVSKNLVHYADVYDSYFLTNDGWNSVSGVN